MAKMVCAYPQVWVCNNCPILVQAVPFSFSFVQVSVCNESLQELSNPGASGSIFFLSRDDEFIIKTVQHKEAEFLQKLLPGYYMVSLLCLLISPSVYFCLTFYLSIYLFVYLSVYLLVCLFVRLSAFLPPFWFVYLSCRTSICTNCTV